MAYAVSRFRSGHLAVNGSVSTRCASHSNSVRATVSTSSGGPASAIRRLRAGEHRGCTAELAEIRDDHIAGLDGDRSRARTREHHLPALEGFTAFTQSVRKPDECRQWMAKNGSARTRLDKLAVAGQDATRRRQVARVRLGCPRAQHDPSRGGVIRNCVDQGDPPVANSTVDDLEGGMDRLDGSACVRDGCAWPNQALTEDERELRLYARLYEPRGGDLVTLAVEHVVDEVTVVRFIDAEHPLHSVRGQSYLVTFDIAAPGHPILDAAQLDGV